MISIRERLEARSNDSLDKEAAEYIKRLEDDSQTAFKALQKIMRLLPMGKPLDEAGKIAAQALLDTNAVIN